MSDATIDKERVKLSSKGRYGLKALFHIAYHSGGRPTQMREIAEHESIPARFLEQIFHELKRAGIVAAKRGPQGGYLLARHPVEITLGDVIRALEGAPVIVEKGARREAMNDPIANTLRDLATNIERCFDDVTIADVCLRGERAGITKRRQPEPPTGEGPEYAI